VAESQEGGQDGSVQWVKAAGSPACQNLLNWMFKLNV